MGYRLEARSGGAEQASLSLQNQLASSTLELAQNPGGTAARWSASGAVALMAGEAFLSRRIDQSFAVARVADYPNVRILVDNQSAGRTDQNGRALLPRLRAYDLNLISIDQRDLPIDARIDALRLEAVPYWRSGVEVVFPIAHANGATFTVQLEDGTPLPVGASLQEVGTGRFWLVGYEGEVYATDLGASTRLRASWAHSSCEFTVTFTPGAGTLPDLGVFTCGSAAP